KPGQARRMVFGTRRNSVRRPVCIQQDARDETCGDRESLTRVPARGHQLQGSLAAQGRNSKRTADIKSHEAATTIARYVYPDRGTSAAIAVEASAYFIDPQAQLDVADIDRQIAWH